MIGKESDPNLFKNVSVTLTIYTYSSEVLQN